MDGEIMAHLSSPSQLVASLLVASNLIAMASTVRSLKSPPNSPERGSIDRWTATPHPKAPPSVDCLPGRTFQTATTGRCAVRAAAAEGLASKTVAVPFAPHLAPAG